MPNNKQYLDRAGLVQVWNKIKSGFYSKTEVDTLLANKQDILTAGDNITITKGTGHDLPSEYKEIEYIYSDGYEYIDTGVNAETGISSRMVVEYITEPSDKCMLGARTATDRLYLVHVYPSSIWCYGYGSYYSLNGLRMTYGIKYDVESKLLSGEQGISVNSFPAGTFGTSTDEYDLNLNLYLFGMNNAGYLRSSSNAKLYECQIYLNGVIQRNFIPCIRVSDDVPGLYDLVTNEFFINAGTEEFGVGPEIVPGTVISAVVDKYSAGNGINISNNNEISIEDGVIFNCGTSTTVI